MFEGFEFDKANQMEQDMFLQYWTIPFWKIAVSKPTSTSPPENCFRLWYFEVEETAVEGTPKWPLLISIATENGSN